MNWIALLVSLSLLVATHELGHLLFAKLFHTRVRRYYIFFNPYFSIIKAKKFGGKWHFLFFNSKTPDSWDEKNLAPEDQDNTLWGLGWVPLGGYCDIAGMIDETKSADDLEAVPQPWEYRTKPAWQRLCIISGGVLVNFISALLIYGMMFAHWGKDELPLRAATLGYDYHEVMLDEGFRNGDIIYAIDGKDCYEFNEATSALLLDNPETVTVLRGDSLVELTMSGHLLERVNDMGAKQLMGYRIPFVVHNAIDGGNAAKAGLMAGDSIVSINDSMLASFSDITAMLGQHADDTVTLGFYRNGELMALPVAVNDAGKIGVQAETDIARLFSGYRHVDYSFFAAIPAGIRHGWETLTTYVSSLKVLFSPGGTKQLGGFKAMADLFPDQWVWQAFWELTALLALVLAFMNIIPIPGLDGGHILFTLWEIVTRRKPSDKFLTVAQNVGMFLLLALMVLANGNDILRWLGFM
ncbi:MAG: RIP metalloprotease RseP [Bacteroidales bacterium]|nr:RIP metalloprotease RseP [Bacteroidales bacterium]